jgi:hypothetical protein
VSPRIDFVSYRHGLAFTWWAANPVLGLGEPGSETDTCRDKIGDGVKTWRELDYTDSETRSLAVPLVAVGVAGGVAGLDDGGTVPMTQLPVNVAGGLPTLGDDGKVAASQLNGSCIVDLTQIITNTAITVNDAIIVQSADITTDGNTWFRVSVKLYALETYAVFAGQRIDLHLRNNGAGGTEMAEWVYLLKAVDANQASFFVPELVGYIKPPAGVNSYQLYASIYANGVAGASGITAINEGAATMSGPGHMVVEKVVLA